jgi:hypothetical protein
MQDTVDQAHDAVPRTLAGIIQGARLGMGRRAGRRQRSPARAYAPRAVSAGKRLAGRERGKACISALVAVPWTRCPPGVGSLSAEPMA